MKKSKTHVIGVRVDEKLKDQIEKIREENPSFLREIIEKSTILSAVHKKFPAYSVDANMWKIQFKHTTKTGITKMANAIYQLICKNSDTDNLFERLSIMTTWFTIHNISCTLKDEEDHANILVNHELGKNFSRLILEIIHLLANNSTTWKGVSKNDFDISKTDYSEIHLFTSISGIKF